MDGTVVLGSRRELADTLVGRPGRDRGGRGPRRRGWPPRSRGPSPAGRRRRQTLVARGSLGRGTGCSGSSPTACRSTPDDVARLPVLFAVSRRGARRRLGRDDHGNAARHVDLWRDVVRRRPRELRAAPAALLGFAAWLAGNGALAWCAVDRPRRPSRTTDWPACSPRRWPARCRPRRGSRSHRTRSRCSRADSLSARWRRRARSRLRHMGEEVAQQEFTREDRTRYREKVRRCLDVFARMLRESRFDADAPMTGLEIELNLVDELGDPALKNAEALEAIADPDFQTELGPVQPRDQRAAQAAQGPRLHRVRGGRAGQPQRTPSPRRPRSAPTW